LAQPVARQHIAHQMLPKMSQDSLEAARRSSEYHAARGFLQPVLEGLSKPDAVRNCLAIL
jgi:hypothetical protein